MLRLLPLLFFLIFFHVQSNATTVPYALSEEIILKKKVHKTNTIEGRFQSAKLSFLQKLAVKQFQKRSKKYNSHLLNDKAENKKKLGTISLILGIAGIVLLFVPYINILVLLTAPAAVITGFIARKDNPDTKSRTKALIGIIAGLVPFFLILLIAVLLSASGFSFSF